MSLVEAITVSEMQQRRTNLRCNWVLWKDATLKSPKEKGECKTQQMNAILFAMASQNHFEFSYVIGVSTWMTTVIILNLTYKIGAQESQKGKQKYRGMFETQKSRNKTSSGKICLYIRTHASPNVGQDQVSGGISVLCWHTAPVVNVLWKPYTIRLKVKFDNKVQISKGSKLVLCVINGGCYCIWSSSRMSCNIR